MRTPLILACVLAGCATQPGPSQADINAYHARLVAQFGPTCARSFKEWTADWTACVDGFALQERAQRAQAAAAILGAMPRPQPIQPATLPAPAPAVTCTTMNYGGMVQTRCQ